MTQASEARKARRQAGREETAAAAPAPAAPTPAELAERVRLATKELQAAMIAAAQAGLPIVVETAWYSGGGEVVERSKVERTYQPGQVPTVSVVAIVPQATAGG